MNLKSILNKAVNSVLNLITDASRFFDFIITVPQQFDNVTGIVENKEHIFTVKCAVLNITEESKQDYSTEYRQDDVLLLCKFDQLLFGMDGLYSVPLGIVASLWGSFYNMFKVNALIRDKESGIIYSPVNIKIDPTRTVCEIILRRNYKNDTK